ncbi:ribbon-helix-helix protein, CopG family [Candidatus Kaiserbacteria bacterium]|nr:ribbon-helix-helix protein, CopG family [Candidatus Kaiserbacteria bacterium]
MSTSVVISVRVPDQLKHQLDSLSHATRRSKAYLATEALTEYVRKNAWKAHELHTAIQEADKGAFISHEAMLAWADSPRRKKAAPLKPDVFLKKRRAS